jgi:hypothetical protein
MPRYSRLDAALVVYLIALVASLITLASWARADEDCEAKAANIHRVCRDQLGDKVQICEQAYLRTLLTCQINQSNRDRG